MQAVTVGIRVIDAPQRENQGFADRPRCVDCLSATLKLAADPKKNYAIFNVLERSSFATRKLTIHLNLQLVNPLRVKSDENLFGVVGATKSQKPGFCGFRRL
ncbi:hypothetical protein [Microcoleus vaginatus]|uniref:hypothetical protein n=1 Tax=Microcoleus vaginatus TaxID=119532 RepID=UPI0032A9B2E9